MAERLPGQQRGGAGKEKQIHFLPRFCFLCVRLYSECSPSQTHRRWIVQITYNLVLLVYDSTTSDEEKNLKFSAPFKQEESPWWQDREWVTCFSTTPRCTHTTLSSGNSSKTGHRLWAVVCRRVKSPAPPPWVSSTNHEKQNLSETSLLQIVVISHQSSAWMTSLGPQGTIYSICFGLRVPELWLRRQSKWSAAASQSHVKWWKCQSHVALLVGPKWVWVQQLPLDLKF